MDVKLDALIEKIKKDGIVQAKHASEEIISKANLEAKKIIDNAKNEAKIIVEQAQKEAQSYQVNAKANISQAARDLKLSLRQKLVETFDNLLKQRMGDALTSEFLKEIILKISTVWVNKETAIEVIVSDKDKDFLQKILLEDFKKVIGQTIEIKVSADINKGFRIGLKNGDIYYDFSDEALTESLRSFANPALQSII